MRFLADECVDERIVQRLRAAGHDVVSTKAQLRGVDDAAVLDAARAERRILITEDKDFGQLVIGRRLLSSGVVLVRPRGLPFQRLAEQILRAVGQYGEALGHLYVVIDGDRTRVRSLPSGTRDGDDTA
jgi:predicted nuclease of predicted toxin-antitoxin system